MSQHPVPNYAPSATGIRSYDLIGCNTADGASVRGAAVRRRAAPVEGELGVTDNSPLPAGYATGALLDPARSDLRRRDPTRHTVLLGLVGRKISQRVLGQWGQWGLIVGFLAGLARHALVSHGCLLRL